MVDCHKIPEVESAQITKWPPSNISSLDAEATYACRYGFSTMIGNPTIRCLINNSWTSPPSCKSKNIRNIKYKNIKIRRIQTVILSDVNVLITLIEVLQTHYDIRC